MSEGMLNLNTEELKSFGKYLQQIGGEMQATCTIMTKHLSDGRASMNTETTNFLLDNIEQYILEIQKMLAGIEETGEEQVKKALAIEHILEELNQEVQKIKTH